MAKKKTNKTEEIKEVEVIDVQTNELKEEEVVVKDEKQIIMEDFINFYNTQIKGKSHVSAELGKAIVDYFNRFSGSKVVYTGCGSCVATKIAYMRKQAKQKYNLVF